MILSIMKHISGLLIAFPVNQSNTETPIPNIQAATELGYGTTELGYGTTNADAGVGIGLLRGGFKNLIEKAIN